jgi:predicted permease
LRTRFSTSLPLLIGVVGIMLLIACANTGSLMLTRAATRRSEFALRLALGSGPFRLLRQVLVEGLVLAGLAGVAGIGIAYWATGVVATYISAGQGRLVLDLAPDTRVLVFTGLVSTLTGLLFAIVPALRASRVELSGGGDLQATRHAVGGRGPGRWLILAEVALSLVLVAGASLFLRSLQHAAGRQAGVARDQILVVRVEPRGSDQRSVPGTTERLDRIYRGLIDDVRRMPGVVAASLARTSPLSPLGFGSPVRTPAGTDVTVPTLMIYPHYFAAMGQPIVKGRDFADDDLRPDAPQVAMVNDAFVREVLKWREPLGVSHGAAFMSGRPPQPMPFEIVGVVKDSPYPDLHTAPRPMLYQTFLQANTGRGQMVLHVRVSRETGGVIGRIREVVQAIDRDVPMFEIRTLESEVDAVLVRERLIAVLSGFFGVLALVLVAIGLYGLLSFTVTRRTAEIGVRMALGAARLSVLWMVIRQTLVLAGAGVAVGVPLAWIVARLSAVSLSGLLFDLAPTDAPTLVLASSVVMLVALAAGWLPARRAARIEPARALRAE